MINVKKWLAALMTAAMVFTSAGVTPFTTIGVYAAEAQDENIQAVLAYGTTSGTKEYDNIADAVRAADKGAQITVTGSINEKHELDKYQASNEFSLDCSGATFSESGAITLSDAAKNAGVICLTSAGNIYKFFPKHKYTQASATAVEGDPTKGQVVLTCANGGESKLVTVNASGDPTTIGGYKVYTYVVNDTNPTVAGIEVAFTDDITWRVEATAGVITYSIDKNDVNYIQDGNKVAIKDANGDVQFYATYFANEAKVLDDNGDEVRLIGTGKKIKNSATPADYENKGSAYYQVEFTLPNGEKAVFDNTDFSTDPKAGTVTSTDKFRVVKVFESDVLKKGKKALYGVQLLFEQENGSETDWSEVQTADFSLPTPPTGYKLATDEDGSLTYRWAYTLTGNTAFDPDDAASFGEEEKLAANATDAATNPSTKYACGAAKYNYSKIEKKAYVGTDGTISSKSLTVGGTNEIAGVHDYANYRTWATQFEQKEAATHTTYGKAIATCACGKTDDNWEGSYYKIPKTDDHDFEKDASGADKIYTVKATCSSYGFQYKKCLTSDNGWTAEGYRLYLGNNHYANIPLESGKTAADLNGANGYHPVLVDGSVSEEYGPHKYYVQSVEWETDSKLAAKKASEDVTCKVKKICMYEGAAAQPVEFVYHKQTIADYLKANTTAKVKEGTTDTVVISGVDNIFGAITADVTPGADCTKGDTFTYKIDGVVDADGDPITSNAVVSTQYYGAHTYKNEVAFSSDAKTAYVIQQCTKNCTENTVDKDGNKKNQQKKAVVTGVDNTDGSTTYTATLEGFELTNNTITVFDLSKAEVTVNDGEPVDLNTITTKADFDDLVAVEINGVPIKYSEYEVVIESNNGVLAPGNNKVTVKAVANAKAVDSKTVIVECEKLGSLAVSEWFVDGIATADKNFEDEFTYDGSVHTVSVTAEDAETRAPKDATIKYAVVYPDLDANNQWVYRYAGTGKKAELDKLSFDLDKVELSEAKLYPYYVFAQMSADGYTTYETPSINSALEVSIDPADKKLVNVYIDNASVIEGNTPNLHIRVIAANGAERGEELNVDLADFTIKTVGGEDLTNLKVGSYQLIATSEKYKIQWDTTQVTNGYMGTLTVLAKDGSTSEEQAAAESATALINALNDNSSAADVAAARAAYDALSATAKKRVDADVVKKLEAAEAAVTAAVVAELQAVTDDTPADVAAKAVNDYNALSAAQKAAVQKDAAAVAGLNKASAISGVEIAGKSASKITIKTSKLTIKRKKAKKIAVTKTGNGKVTFTNKSTKAVKKVIKVSSAGKIKVTKKAKKGKIYKVKVVATIAATATYKKATSKVKTIKVKVK